MIHTNMQNIILNQILTPISINITAFLQNDIFMKYQNRLAKSYLWRKWLFLIGVRIAAVYAMFGIGKSYH